MSHTSVIFPFSYRNPKACIEYEICRCVTQYSCFRLWRSKRGQSYVKVDTYPTILCPTLRPQLPSWDWQTKPTPAPPMIHDKILNRSNNCSHGSCANTYILVSRRNIFSMGRTTKYFKSNTCSRLTKWPKITWFRINPYRATHICISKLVHYFFRISIVACSGTRYYVKQCWPIANCAVRNNPTSMTF